MPAVRPSGAAATVAVAVMAFEISAFRPGGRPAGRPSGTSIRLFSYQVSGLQPVCAPRWARVSPSALRHARSTGKKICAQLSDESDCASIRDFPPDLARALPGRSWEALGLDF